MFFFFFCLSVVFLNSIQTDLSEFRVAHLQCGATLCHKVPGSRAEQLLEFKLTFQYSKMQFSNCKGCNFGGKMLLFNKMISPAIHRTRGQL